MAKKFDFKKIGMKAAGLGAGAVVASVVSAKVPFVANLNPKIQGAAKIVLGALLPSFVKNEFIGHMGDGMIAQGAGQLVSSFMPAVSGYDDSVGEGYVEDYTYPMNGITDDDSMSGDSSDDDQDNY